MRPNGERVSLEKRVWYEGRGIWTYSYLYNNFSREQKYLDIAAASVRLLERSKPMGSDEFWPKVLNRDGTPASEGIPSCTEICLLRRVSQSSPRLAGMSAIGLRRAMSF